MTKLPRVLIAEDHEAVAREVVRLVSGQFEVVGTVRDGNLVVAAATSLQPDVVLLDLSLPHVDGFDALERLKRLGPGCKIIVVTMHADAMIAAEALKRGASGFVAKSNIGEELLLAIDAVLSGKTYLARILREEIKELMLGAVDPGTFDLTAEQREVLRLIVQGQRAREIASMLGIPASSVVAIKDSVMKRLGVQSTADLVRYVINHRLDRNSASHERPLK